MATQTLALLVLAQNYAGDIVRQINRRSVLLQALRAVPGEGLNHAWSVESDGAVAQTHAEGSNVTTFGSDAQTAASLLWGQYEAPFAVTTLAQAAAATSRSPDGVMRLWQRNMMNSITALTSKINVDLYTAGASNKLVGLADAIGDDGNTYASIDRTVLANAFWKPYVADNGGVPQALTQPQIREDMMSIMINCGVKPNLAMVHPLTLVKIAETFDPSKQYIFNVIRPGQTVDGGNGSFVLEGGVGSIVFDGCVFVEDKDCPTDVIYYLNTDYLDLVYLPQPPIVVPGNEMMDLSSLADGSGATMPAWLRISALDKTGHADKAYVESVLQLACRRPNAMGVRKDIL